MSDELRLPDELAACEARLAAQIPPATRIDRDQLMYRAGWSACEAQLQHASPTIAIRGRGLAVAWSVASTAIAASLALVLALQEQPMPQPTATEVLATSNGGATAGSSQPAAPSRAEKPMFEPNFAASGSLPGSGLLAMRRQALMNIWPEPVRVTAVSGVSSEAGETSDGLLREPRVGSGEAIRAWSPGGRRIGDSI